jgi:membrane protein
MRFSFSDLIKRTVKEWQQDNVPTQAAALAYYTIFALAPLLLVVLAVAGLFVPADAARNRLLSEAAGLIGKDGADWLRLTLERASMNQGTGILSVVLGTGGLILGASGAFGQLQQALNKIWDAKPPANLGALVRARAVSFGLVLVLGFLLLVSLSVSAALSGLGERLGLGTDTGWLWGLLYEIFSVILVGFLFALIYRFLPDAPVGWREALIGGLVTSVLFGVGKTLIGLYLGRNAGASVFGAAGTLAVVLLWIYYAAQLVLFGAEFTQVMAQDNPAQSKVDAQSTQSQATQSQSTQALEEPTVQETSSTFKSKLESNPNMKLWAGVATVAMVVWAWRDNGKVKRSQVSSDDRQKGSA